MPTRGCLPVQLTLVAFCAAFAAACGLPRPAIDNDGRVTMFAGDKLPRLEFSAPGVVITDINGRSDVQFVAGSDNQTGFTLSALLYHQEHTADCREEHWQAVQQTPGFKAENVHRREVGALEIVEYTLPYSLVPGDENTRIDQYEIIACTRRAGAGAYLHLSQTQYRPEHQPRLDAILKSTRLVTE